MTSSIALLLKLRGWLIARNPPSQAGKFSLQRDYSWVNWQNMSAKGQAMTK
jgi:hypothetical protein